MKKSFVYVTLLLMGVLTSCGKDHSNEIDLIVPFYQNLGVEYDMTANKTYAGANFNKKDSAGANLKLPAGAVLINGEEPLFENIGVYFYKASFDGLQNVTFTFNRSKEQVFVNKASTSDATPIDIPMTFTAIDGNGTTVLTWDGDPVAKGEYVALRLEYKGGNLQLYNRDEGGQSISIPFNNQTGATDATLYLSRVTTHPLQQSNGSAGGKIDVSYTISKKVAIQ